VNQEESKQNEVEGTKKGAEGGASKRTVNDL